MNVLQSTSNHLGRVQKELDTNVTDTDLDDKQKSSYINNFLVLHMNHQMYNSDVIDITQGLLRVQP